MSQSAKKLYREVLLDHFHNPRGKTEFSKTDAVSRGSNPQCGDEVEIALGFDESGSSSIRFKGRGCSVCLASASIMSDACSGLALSELQSRHAQILSWLMNKDKTAELGPTIDALDLVRSHPARVRCVLLAWEALGGLIKGVASSSERLVSIGSVSEDMATDGVASDSLGKD